jgi:Sulfotransferase family
MPARHMGPIFIVGCQRSGTTVLRLMLDSHSRISCGPETLFLADMERIVTTDWRRLSRFGFEQDEWLARIAAFFSGIHHDYAVARGKQRWADKSPRYAMHMDFIARMFPDAQFVHVIRDGRDVAVSHRKRFGYLSSVRSTVKWPRYVAAARASAAKLESGRYFEVRYERLVADNEGVARELLDFLGEEWEPQILDFDKKEHDVPDRYYSQLAARRASANTADAVYPSRVGTYRRELDPLMKALLWVTSRSTLRELGYTGTPQP